MGHHTEASKAEELGSKHKGSSLPSAVKPIWSPASRTILGEALPKSNFAAGFVKVQGHECLYVHREKQLFLSVYVDDFKMAGKTSNLSTMWETLGKKIFLDPPVPLQSNVYLGSSQTPVEVPLKDLQQKFDTWKGFFHDKGGQKEPENVESGSATQSHGQDADQRCPIFASLDSKAVSYTHLTLPTIYSV